MFRYQLKLLPWPGVALTGLMLALVPLFISFRFLDFAQVATVGETVAPLMGVLLITPLAFCEGPVGRREGLGCRPFPYWQGFAQRLLTMGALAGVGLCLLVSMAALSANPFSQRDMVVGLLTTLLLYGSLGLTCGHLTGSQPGAFLLPLGLFALEYYTKGQYTGRFFTLSLMQGGLQKEKWALLLGALGLLGANVPLCMAQLSLRRG